MIERWSFAFDPLIPWPFLLALGLCALAVAALALARRARAIANGQAVDPDGLRRYGTREIADLAGSVFAMAASLEKRGRAMRDFAMHLSHEFKTPLSAIRGSAELLADNHADMDAARRSRFLNAIQDDVERLSRLIGRLMELARAENPAPDEAATDISTAMIALEGDFGSVVTAQTGNGRLGLSAENFRILAAALIDNAAQAGAKTVRIDAQIGDRDCQIRFADDGPGVSPGNQSRLFEPFFTTKRADGGTGLGLGIARSIAESHGGALTFEPSRAGAVFRLTLPLNGQG